VKAPFRIFNEQGARQDPHHHIQNAAQGVPQRTVLAQLNAWDDAQEHGKACPQGGNTPQEAWGLSEVNQAQGLRLLEVRPQGAHHGHKGT